MKIFDSNEVSCIACGVPIDSGRGEEGGKFVTVERLTDAFVDVVSVDGEATRSKTNDDRADITITTMSSSGVNAILSALHTLDRKAANGAGVGPFLLKDNQGTTLFAAAECWLVKMPKWEGGQKSVPLEWKFRVAKLIDFVGGN
jgi:hypothetical protein